MAKHTNKHRQRGDTLVEVLLATVIMSVVITTAYALANRSTRFNQASFERTAVTNKLQEQLEFLRTARIIGGPVWDSVWSQSTNTQPLSASECAAVTDFSAISTANRFYLSQSGAEIVNNPSSGLVTGQYRILMHAKTITPTVSDFTVSACWPGLGSDVNNFAGLVLRLEKDSS